MVNVSREVRFSRMYSVYIVSAACAGCRLCSTCADWALDLCSHAGNGHLVGQLTKSFDQVHEYDM